MRDSPWHGCGGPGLGEPEQGTCLLDGGALEVDSSATCALFQAESKASSCTAHAALRGLDQILGRIAALFFALAERRQHVGTR